MNDDDEDHDARGNVRGGFDGIVIGVAVALLGPTRGFFPDKVWPCSCEAAEGKFDFQLGFRTSIFEDFHSDEFAGRIVPGSIKWEPIVKYVTLDSTFSKSLGFWNLYHF